MKPCSRHVHAGQTTRLSTRLRLLNRLVAQVITTSPTLALLRAQDPERIVLRMDGVKSPHSACWSPHCPSGNVTCPPAPDSGKKSFNKLNVQEGARVPANRAPHSLWPCIVLYCACADRQMSRTQHVAQYGVRASRLSGSLHIQ